MKKLFKKEEGLLSLEASICLTIFMFLMLFLYSFFVVFEARNTMGHNVLSTANSLALDAYATDKFSNADSITAILYDVYGDATNGLSDFADHSKWYENSTVTDDDGNETISAELQTAIKRRFLAYLTAGETGKNSEETANKILKRYHIQNGVSGLDFSGSYVDSEDRLHVVLRYTMEYEYNPFGLGTVELEQSACSKIWK